MRRKISVPVLATAALTAGLWTAPSVRADICVGAPKLLPNPGGPVFDGAPRWFSTDPTTTSATTDWLNDARWANAARSYMTSGTATARTDGAIYRLVYDPAGYLLVSIQATFDPGNSADTSDSVYFGISDEVTGYAFKFRMPGAGGTLNKPQALNQVRIDTSTNVSDPASWQAGQVDAVPTNGYLKVPAAWTVQDVNGGSVWGVNFKLDLRPKQSPTDTSRIGYPAGTRLRVAVGAYVDDASMNLDAKYEVPIAGAAATIFSVDGMLPRTVFSATPAPTDWTRTAPLGAACTGITVPQGKIGTLTNGTWELPGTYLTMGMGITHSLIATPQKSNGTKVNDGSITAKFRLANWGSQATDKGWTPIQFGPEATPVVDVTVREVSNSGDLSTHFSLPCRQNTADKTCGITLQDLERRVDRNGKPYSHQCMLVEMSPAPGFGDITFGNASEYRNTDFERLSAIERVAKIDVRGLQQIAGNKLDRPVYLYVQKKNMPAPGATETNLPREQMMESLLRETGAFQCSNPLDTCVAGSCAWSCNAYGGCSGGVRVDVSGCWCEEEEGSEPCFIVPPAPGDGKSSLSFHDTLAKTWPYMEVYAYWDTGKTRMVDGVSHKIMQAMYPFGFFFDHAGPFYGFETALEGLDVTVNRIREGVYKLTVPNESSKLIKVKVKTVDKSAAVPLVQMHGAATQLGIFGTVEIVALSESTQPMNLSRASASFTNVLLDGTRELVNNMRLPTTLNRQPGATPCAAVFSSSSGPATLMEVVELPILGRLTNITIVGADVSTPSVCGPFGGIAKLKTAFTITDGINSPLVSEGTDDWACAPFVLVNP